MFECELVWEFVGCAAEDRSVEEEVQRRAAAQQFRECAASGVCATHCSAPSAYGGLRAAMRGTKRGRSHEFRRSWCCMIPCAELGGSSSPGKTRKTSGRPAPSGTALWLYGIWRPRKSEGHLAQLDRRGQIFVIAMGSVFHDCWQSIPKRTCVTYSPASPITPSTASKNSSHGTSPHLLRKHNPPSRRPSDRAYGFPRRNAGNGKRDRKSVV